MSSRKPLSLLVWPIIPFICVACADENAYVGEWRDFYYSYGMENDYKNRAFYSDELFQEKASIYNPTLSAASMALALAGFSSNREETGSYKNRFRNGKAYLEAMGFQDVTPNADYLVRPQTDSFGCIFGHKKIGDQTLIAITVRGRGYLQEWASNVTLGTADYGPQAQGFHEASNIYLASLAKYLADNSISGPIKIWAAGYSRGAAATNLAMGRLDEELLSGAKNLLPTVTYTKDDIYAYCFEPPAGGGFAADDATSFRIKGDDFSNIHCLVNLNDPVSMVGPKEFSFARYGQDYYLSDPLTDVDHGTYIKKVEEIFNSLENASVLGEYVVDDFEKKVFFGEAGVLGADQRRIHYTQGLYLSDFIHRFAGVLQSRDGFVNELQEPLRKIFEMVYGKNTPRDSLINIGLSVGRRILNMDPDAVLFHDLVYQRGKFVTDLEPFLYRALEEENLSVDTRLLISFLKSIFSTLLGIAVDREGINVFASFISRNNIKGFAQAHRPELCLAHMMAMDPMQGKMGAERLRRSYYVLRSTGCPDAEILCNGRVIAQFQEGKPIAVDSSFAYGVDANSAFVYLPPEQEYAIRAFQGSVGFTLYQQRSNSASEAQKATFSVSDLSGKTVSFSAPDTLK